MLSVVVVLTLPCKVFTACLSILPNNILPLITGHLPEVDCMKGLLEMRLNVPPQFATVCQLCLTSSDWFTVFWKMKKSLKVQKARHKMIIILHVHADKV